MPAVLVHGVPETTAVWDGLRSHLHRDDVVALALPGFGNPRPDGFTATKEAYVEWLVGELERLQPQRPLDLVGHDWGGGFTIRVVSTRPDLVRSWVTDAAGIGGAAFEWHDFAKLWQTLGAGEQFFDEWLAKPVSERPSVFGHLDRTMADCILALYRSAVDVGQEWSRDFRDIPAPGLVVVPSDDPFLSSAAARRAADAAGARVAELDGLGHWWMVDDPARGAAMLEDFWSSLA